MLRYLLSHSLLAFSLLCYGQQQTPEKVKEKEPPKPGLSIGMNVGTFIVRAFEPERFGVEATARYQFNRKWFAVGEVGFENTEFDREPMAYSSNGSFLRIGADYNFFKVDEVDNNDNILLGLRYGVSVLEHSASRVTLYDDYWGNYVGSIPAGVSNVHWAEAVFGLRSEIWKNFYMGWSVRVRRLIKTNNETILEPYAIPGYGKRDNATNLSFTYNLEYHLPFYRNKK